MNSDVEKTRQSWMHNSCCCSDSRRCKKLMLRFEALGGDYMKMINWVLIPKEIDRKDIDEHQHLNTYREMLQQCLQFQPTTKKLTIAPHHFKEGLNLALERTRKELKTLNKFRCTEEEATKCGIDSSYQCIHLPGRHTEISYFLIPNNCLTTTEQELRIAEANNCLRQLTKIGKSVYGESKYEKVRITTSTTLLIAFSCNSFAFFRQHQKTIDSTTRLLKTMFKILLPSSKK